MHCSDIHLSVFMQPNFLLMSKFCESPPVNLYNPLDGRICDVLTLEALSLWPDGSMEAGEGDGS